MVSNIMCLLAEYRGKGLGEKLLSELKESYEPIDVTINRIGFIKFRPIETLFAKSL